MKTPKAAATAPAPLGILRGHGVPVNSVSALSADAIASGSADGIVKLWSLRTRRELASRAAHSKAGVLHTTVLDAKRLITHGRDGYVKLWDIESFGNQSDALSTWYCGSFTFTKVATMRYSQGSGSPCSDLVICPSAQETDILAYDARMDSAQAAMCIRVPDDGKKRGMCMSLSLFSAQTTASEDSAAHAYIAAGWEGGQLSLLDMRAGGKLACEAQIAQATSPLLAFDVTQDGRTAICGSSAEELSVATIDYTSLTIAAHPFFQCNHGGISSIRLRADQRIFATAGWDHRVRIFHTRKLKSLAILKYHSESVFGVDFTPDNRHLVSASKDHKLALWSIYPPSSDETRPRRSQEQA